MIDWKIQSRATACQSCGKAFADKDTYYTLLFDKRHGLDRLDVCPECWQNQHSQGANDRKGFISFWHGVFSVPPPPPPEAIQKESAESLLRKLVELNDPQYEAACFILAVMLERKRIFKVKAQTKEEGRRIICYEHPKSGDVFTIADPALQLQQLETVQQQVAQLLEHGLPDENDTMPEGMVATEFESAATAPASESEAAPEAPETPADPAIAADPAPEASAAESEPKVETEPPTKV